jgi:hypothetical protein
MNEIYNCTFCEKKLNSTRAVILGYFITEKINTSGYIEKIYNSEVVNREVVCDDCFKNFITSYLAFKES